jgi:hypothetical protein
MNSKDVKIGMKVVPFQKTAFDQFLCNSVAWGRAKYTNQDFLYVTMFDVEEGFWVLAPSMGESGDYFNAEDFYEYEEIPEISDVSAKITRTTEEIIFVEHIDSYHKASVKQTNGNWGSAYFWYLDVDGQVERAEIDLSQLGFLVDTLTELQKQIETKRNEDNN